MKIQSAKTLVLSALLFTCPFLSQAQEFPPEHSSFFQSPFNLPLLLLLVAGAVYGLFKMRQSNKQITD